MKCGSPFYKAKNGGKADWDYIKTKSPKFIAEYLMPLRCGKCFACRLFHASCWATRVVLERTQYTKSAFVTLTYDPKFLPKDGSVHKKEVKNFLKRLRYYLGDRKIRYFAVGEYGTKSLRPHYHLIIFNLCFTEKKIIDKAWSLKGVKLGHTYLGDVTNQSARYCTEYCVKKWNKNNDRRPADLEPEFMLSSRDKPGGIGASAIDELATNLRKAYRLKPGEMYTGKPIVSIMSEGRLMPLDRYMRVKLNEALYLDENVTLENLCRFQNEYFGEFWDSTYALQHKHYKRIANKHIEQVERKINKFKPKRTKI